MMEGKSGPMHVSEYWYIKLNIRTEMVLVMQDEVNKTAQNLKI